MSRNEVGLKSARGTGTSGYVVKNLSSIGDKVTYDQVQKKRKKQKQLAKDDTVKVEKLKNELKVEINKHEESRKVERSCMELRDQLEEENVPEPEILERLKEHREKLLLESLKVLKTLDSKPHTKGTQEEAKESKESVFDYKPLYKDSR